MMMMNNATTAVGVLAVLAASTLLVLLLLVEPSSGQLSYTSASNGNSVNKDNCLGVFPISSGHKCSASSSNLRAWGVGAHSLSVRYKHDSWDLDEVFGRGEMLVYLKPEICACGNCAAMSVLSVSDSTVIYQGSIAAHHGVSAQTVRYKVDITRGADGALVATDSYAPWDGAGVSEATGDTLVTIPSFVEDFALVHQFYVVDGSGNDQGGIIDFYDAASRYTSGHRPSSCGSKTITRFKYRFKYRDCAPGKYQYDMECRDCKAETYNEYWWRTQVDDNVPCKNCSCVECETCTAATGACPVDDGRCRIDGVCRTQEDRLGTKMHEPCQRCISESSKAVWTGVTRSHEESYCDDEDQCTRVDECVDGVCKGTPFTCLNFAHTDNLWENCEICDGDKCVQDPEWTGAICDNQCGCLIDTQCWPHGTTHPNSTCMVCDVTRHTTEWVPALPRPCDDGISCTHSDTCSDGVCVGEPYECTDGPACLVSSSCTGMAPPHQCKLVFEPSTLLCAPQIDQCTLPVYCTGHNATCPPQVPTFPSIDMAGVHETTAEYDPVDLVAQEALHEMHLNLQGFGVACGTLEVSWGIFDDSFNDAPCHPDSVDGSVPGGAISEFQPYTPHLSRDNIVLLTGRTYKVIVTARNLYGGERTTCSNGVLVDGTPPQFDGAVLDVDPETALPADVQHHDSLFLEATWHGFADPESSFSGQLHYWVAVGTMPGAHDIQNFTFVGTNTTFRSGPHGEGLAAATLYNGVQYFITVRGVNKAGGGTEASSDGVVHDSTPPDVHLAFVHDGLVLGADADFQLSRTLGATWGGFQDEHSPIVRYDVAWGTSPGLTDISGGFKAVALQNSAQYDTTAPGRDAGLPHLNAGRAAYATVRVTNAAGGWTTLSSNGVTFDESPPSSGVVNDALPWPREVTPMGIGYTAPDDADFIPGLVPATLIAEAGGADTPAAGAAWRWVEEESEIVAVMWSLGTGTASAAERSNILAPVRVGATNDSWASTALLAPDVDPAALQAAGLTHGATVYSCASSINAVGLASAVHCSNGAVVDSTPPLPTSLTVADADPWQAGDTDLRFHTNTTFQGRWNAVLDDESGIATYAYRVLSVQAAPDAGGNGRHAGSSAWMGDSGMNVTVEVPWTSTAFVLRTPLMEEVPQGVTLYTQVRGYNRAGLWSQGTSGGILVDTSQPPTGEVHDGTVPGVDLAFHHSPTKISASWSGFEDPESGIEEYRYAVGVCGGEPSTVVDWTSVDGSQTDMVETGLALTGGVSYCVSVIAVNHAGLEASGSSNGAEVDFTGPIAGVVNDGPASAAVDVDFQTDADHVLAHWTGFSDPDSGVTFRAAVGTAPGLDDLLPFKEYGTGTSFNRSLSAQGRVVYTTVEATNGAGISVFVTSDGVTVDSSPPLVGRLRYGSSVEFSRAFQHSTSSLVVNIDGFVDMDSGIDRYEWSIGTSVGGTNVLAMTSVETRTVLKATGLSLAAKGRYFVTLVAVNLAGLMTRVEDEAGVVVDPSPPSCGAISVGAAAGSHDAALPYDDHLRVHVDGGFGDDESGLRFQYRIGTTRFGRQYSELAPLPQPSTNTSLPPPPAPSPPESYTITGLHLVTGSSYHVTIVARNGAGDTCEVTSPAFLVDPTPPVVAGFLAADVQPGPSLVNATVEDDIDVGSSGTALAVVWTASSDPESGLTGYEVAFGTTEDPEAVTAFTSVDAGVTRYEASDLELAGGWYRATIRAVNAAGSTRTVRTSGVAVDATPPVAGSVSDGLLPDHDAAITASVLAAHVTWSVFSDAETRVVGYEVALANSSASCHGGSPDGMLTQWQDAGLRVRHTFTWASGEQSPLGDGDSYVACVRAENSVGLTVVATSNGVTVDTTAPLSTDAKLVVTQAGFGVANATAEGRGLLAPDHGNRTSIAYIARSPVYVVWAGFEEPSTPGVPLRYQLAVGTTPGGSDVAPFVDVLAKAAVAPGGLGSSTLQASLSSVRFADGEVVYVSAVAINEAGLVSLAVSSDGIRVTKAPPGAFVVLDGPAGTPERSAQGSRTTLQAHWSPAQPPLAGLREYRVRAVASHGVSGTVVPVTEWRSVDMATHVSLTGLALKSNTKYRVQVQAVSYANTVREAATDGLIVDTTAPLPGAISVGTFAATHQAFVAEVHRIHATWSAFVDAESQLVSCRTALLDATTGELLQGRPWEHVGLRLSHAHDFEVSNTTTAAPVAVGGAGVNATNATNATAAMNATEATNATNTVNATELVAGDMFQAVVRCTNQAGLTSTAVSNVTTVDTTPALPGVVLDTTLAWSEHDLDVQGNAHAVAARWSHFVDDESGVVRYEAAVGTTPGGTQVAPFRLVHSIAKDGTPGGPGTHPSVNYVTVSGLFLDHATTVYTTVRATNGAGVVSTATSDGVVIDQTPPAPFAVWDGDSDDDLDVWEDRYRLFVNWREPEDDFASVLRYDVSVGTSRGDASIVPVTRVLPIRRQLEVIQLAIPDGAYVATVTAITTAHNQRSSYSDGFFVDGTPPVLEGARVSDGVEPGSAGDVDFQANVTWLRGAWSGIEDPHSGVVEYKAAVVDSDGEVVVAWRSVGMEQSVFFEGLDLAPGSTYHVAVRARNGAGLWSDDLTSDGITIDVVPPFLADVHGMPLPPEASSQVNITASIGHPTGTTLATAAGKSCSCTRAHETFVGAGAAAQCVCKAGFVRDAVGDCVACPFGWFKASTNGTTCAKCPHGTTSSAAGDSCVCFGDGNVFDLDAKACVCDAGYEASPTGGNACVACKWLDGFYKAQRGSGSNCSACPSDSVGLPNGAGCLCTSPLKVFDELLGVCVCAPGTWHNTSLAVQGTLQECVPCGPDAVATQPGSTSCTSCPAGTVRLGPSECGCAQPGAVLLDGSTCVCPAGTVPVNTTDASIECQPCGTAWHYAPEATPVSWAQSPPARGACTLCPPLREEESYFSTSGPSHIFASWSGVFGDALSGIRDYRVAVGTTRFGTQVKAFESTHGATSVSLWHLALDSGQEVFVTVMAIDGVGHVSFASSQALVHDETPPVAGEVVDGTVTDAEYELPMTLSDWWWDDSVQELPEGRDRNVTSNTTQLVLAWEPWWEPEGGLRSVGYCFGLHPGDCSVVGLTLAPGGTREGMLAGVALLELEEGLLRSDEQYFGTVVAVSCTGLRSNASSSGVLLDVQPPVAGLVLDGDEADGDIDCAALAMEQGIPASLSITWSGFSDAGAGLAGFDVALGSAPLLADITNFTRVSSHQRVASWFANEVLVPPGTVVYGTVRAVDEVGLTSTASSDGVKIVCGAGGDPMECERTGFTCLSLGGDPAPAGPGEEQQQQHQVGSDGFAQGMDFMPPIAAL